jgi:hypothetical protein
MDLHWSGCPESGSWEHGNWPKSTNKPGGFLPFKKAFVPMFLTYVCITYLKYIFHEKINLCFTLKSDQDPD